jgi:hypothetical protein
MRLAPRRPSGDTGAASLEYAGVLFLVGAVIASLLLFATPIGAAIQERLCAAVGAVCGSAAAEQRAEELGVKCTVARTNRDLGYDVAVAGYRGERKDTDGITTFGDGTSVVTMTQGSGAGVDGSSGTRGGGVGVNAKATVNGDLGYVYSFPAELGGPAAAERFLGRERDGLGQAIDIVVPGMQTLDEGATRVVDGAGNFVEDRILSPIGMGPSAQERAERERRQRAETADAVTVSLSVQGSAGVNVGAGTPARGPQGQAPGTPGAGTTEGPLAAGVQVKVVVKGTSTIGLTTGRSDSVSSSFTGSASAGVDLNVLLGLPGDVGQRDIPPFLTVAGQASAAGSYKVVFDKDGNPSQLVLAYDYGLGGKAGLTPPKLGSREVKVGLNSGGGTVTERTVILDLDRSTPEGRANHAAFDRMFAVVGVDAGGRTAKVAVPDTTDIAGFFAGWAAMNDRIDRDGFIVDASYSENKRADDVGAKFLGTGLGGNRSTTTRRLEDASLFDNRFGGTEVALASCGAP